MGNSSQFEILPPPATSPVSQTAFSVLRSSIINYYVGNMNLSIVSRIPGYLYINPTNGQISTAKRLTGKGRSDPYEMKIRAEDNGEPGLFTDVKLSLYISDIIENDGVPTFVHPTADEIAYVSEVNDFFFFFF